MNRKSILQIEPELLGSPEYLASRAAISGVIPRFSRTMSLTVGGETRRPTANRRAEMSIGSRNPPEEFLPDELLNPPDPHF
jgi:hypothetical protein